MDEVTISAIKVSLDSLALRQTYLAQNIANANSPGYQSVKVQFEEQLAIAAAGGVDEIEALQPEISREIRAGVSPDMRLDLELAQSAQTAMRYSALINVLGRQMSMLMSVVRGGQQ